MRLYIVFGTKPNFDQMMKMKFLFMLILCSTPVLAQLESPGQGPPAGMSPKPLGTAASPSPFAVVERGPHHRVWQSVILETNALGRITATTNSYKELETGMHTKDTEGHWIEASDQFEIQEEGGAVAPNAQHYLYCPGSLYSDALQCKTPDGKILTSRPLGLSFYDGQTNVLIAELRDGPTGQLLPSGNQVLYTNICVGSRLDLLVRNRKSGYESDLIIREQLPNPSELGFADSSVIRIQWWTEFFESPEPAKTLRALTDGTEDQALAFGEMKMGRGKAFLTGAQTEFESDVPVTKQWVELDGRTFLVEEIPLSKVGGQLSTLPMRTAGVQPRGTRMLAQALKDFGLRAGNLKKLLAPVLPAKRPAKRSPATLIASTSHQNSEPGFVVDYDLSGSLTNFTFRSDTTYYITNYVSLIGNTTIEGGSVIKFTTNVNSAVLAQEAVLVCQTSPFRPSVWTAKDDNSIGTAIPGSSGFPTNYYAPGAALTIPGDSALSNLFFRYLGTAVDATAGGLDSFLSDVQFTKCRYPLTLAGNTVYLRNGLFYEGRTNFYGSGVVRGENLTFHKCGQLFEDYEPTGSEIFLTNCLLVAVTNLGNNYSLTTNTTVTLTDDSGVFQVIGAGAHYLATNSPYRNAGTTSINTSLLTDLRTKTTYPPIVLSNITVSVDTTLNPQAQRDTDLPDLGYHYDPIDYITSNYVVTNATLQIRNGTIIGYYDDAGIWLQDGAVISSIGQPTAMNRFADYRTVQEQPIKLGSWSGASTGMPVDCFRSSGTAAAATFRFTAFSRLAPSGQGFDVYVGGNFLFSSLSISDCSFLNGNWNLEGGPGFSLGLTNSLCERTTIWTFMEGVAFVFNNLFRGGDVSFFDFGTTPWLVKDNVFDSGSVADMGDPVISEDHNAFINVSLSLASTNASDLLLTNFVYGNGPLGNYYQVSTILANAGSRSATAAGLYHYTTVTNLVNGLQIKETNSVVDIGFHYAAVNANNQPIDSDNDLVPDFLEDLNGNEAVNSGETDWRDATDLGLKVTITRPKNSSTIP